MECRRKERELTLIKDASKQGRAAPGLAIQTLLVEFPTTGTGANGDVGC
jgi:hypothetical protein